MLCLHLNVFIEKMSDDVFMKLETLHMQMISATAKFSYEMSCS